TTDQQGGDPPAVVGDVERELAEAGQPVTRLGSGDRADLQPYQLGVGGQGTPRAGGLPGWLNRLRWLNRLPWLHRPGPPRPAGPIHRRGLLAAAQACADLADGTQLAQLRRVQFREARQPGAYRGQDLYPLDGVDPEVGFHLQVSAEHLDRVPGTLRHDRDQQGFPVHGGLRLVRPAAP